MRGETDTLPLSGRVDNGDDGPVREGYGGVLCGAVTQRASAAAFWRLGRGYRTGSLSSRVDVVVPGVLVAPAVPTVAWFGTIVTPGAPRTPGGSFMPMT
jgi:hypothetical protein